MSISKLKSIKPGYRLIGKHSAVEICRFTKSVLRGGRNCYKRWFGIESHRCIQMTPSLMCNFACQFCWRRSSKPQLDSQWDNAKFIFDWMIKSQKDLLSGFGGNIKTTKKLFNEALNPKHVAISLDGEPTLYPYLPEFIKEIKLRDMTAFLVTNGTMPNRINELLKKNAEPTNLYISIYGTNEEDYKKICNPLIDNYFENVVKSLKLMKKFEDAKTIFRITAVKNINMRNFEEYSELIKLSQPQFVEIKGYAWLGESRNRLKEKNVPNIGEIEEFVNNLELINYKIISEDDISRVVLLSKN